MVTYIQTKTLVTNLENNNYANHIGMFHKYLYVFAFVCELLRMKVSAMAGCYKMGNINITNELK